MLAWLKRFHRKVKRSWWWWLVLAILALVQDRALTTVNEWIDAQAGSGWRYLGTFLNWANEHSLGIIGLVFAITLVALMVAAILEGMPSTGGTHTGEASNKPRPTTSNLSQPISSIDRSRVQIQANPPISGLLGSGVKLQQSQAEGKLGFFLTNSSSPDPLRSCRVFITSFRIWSDTLKKFGAIKEFDGMDEFFPMLIHGPDDYSWNSPFCVISSKLKTIPPAHKISRPRAAIKAS